LLGDSKLSQTRDHTKTPQSVAAIIRLLVDAGLQDIRRTQYIDSACCPES